MVEIAENTIEEPLKESGFKLTVVVEAELDLRIYAASVKFELNRKL